MKQIFAIALTIFISACASTQNQVSPRDPASLSTPPTLPKFGSLLYQGPFLVNPDGATRVPSKTYLPIQYDTKKNWPLVILLHGFTGSGEGEDDYLTVRFRVSTKGFILSTPDGTHTPAGTLGEGGKDLSGVQFWNATDSCCDFAKTGVDDVGYITALVNKLKAQYNVDPNRIYIFGHSNGGFMANRLACETGIKIAGIASLAGGTYKDASSCAHPKPIPYLQIQGVDDKTILYQNAPTYSGGKETVAQWRERNGCSAQSETGPRSDFVFLILGKDTTPESWRNCSSGKEVDFWTIQPSNVRGHNAHVPLFNLNFTDAVLDFLLRQES